MGWLSVVVTVCYGSYRLYYQRFPKVYYLKYVPDSSSSFHSPHPPALADSDPKPQS